MKILAFESSAKAASVALTDGDRLLSQYFQDSGLTHSRTLLKMAQDMLANTEQSLQDVDRLAVSVGPGSFTGVRIGVAAAKGLAWGADLPICGVSTLEAMASLPEIEGVILCPVMDARRSQIYNAKFEYRGGSLVRLCDDRALSIAELAEEARVSARPFCLLGDGAELCFPLLPNAVLAPKALRQQSAYGVSLAALHCDATDVSALVPVYLRPSQAERELGKK
ncbi:MAG: tRNA (adenosine(37)-N6)-threonylcarbamoyltransferase complex dimerization subunit type 1 TsaB [Oscillospiraceae bacterium]|jgi:tRNA threonylcarbamoyladenosine biosynthesis protein TsaB|nr:tRNA (adenosine(37)-N6)-threonylcarbamoyltransferase complex dimerization subunit type 1 TsaB [Oscillospiraceae bacterium]